MTTPGQPGWPGGQPPYGQQPYGQQPYGQPGVPLYGQPAMPAGPRPRPVTASMWLMILGGVLSLIGALVNVAVEYDSMRSDFVTDVTTGPEPMTYDEAESVWFIVLALGLALAVIMSIIWVALGCLVGRGKNWARITATVLGVLGGLCAVCGVFVVLFDGSLVSSAVTVVTGIVGVASIILLWIPDANRWFAAKGAEGI